MMTELDEKILENFPGKVVRKDLTNLMKKGANVPTYVLEYLLVGLLNDFVKPHHREDNFLVVDCCHIK